MLLRKLLQMSDLLFTVEHLPTLDTQHLSVTLRLDVIELLNEDVPLGGVAFNHY